MTIPGHHDDGAPDGCTAPDCLEAAARGDRWIGVHLSLDDERRGYFHHREELHASVRAQRDTVFAGICARFDADPGDFATAWAYLTQHPIFWRPYLPSHLDRRLAGELRGDELDEALHPQHVEEHDGLRNMGMHVRDGGHGAEVHLDHGPHLWVGDVSSEDRRFFLASGHASYDPRLDVVAESYEEAIIALAALVRHVYGDDRSRVSADRTGR